MGDTWHTRLQAALKKRGKTYADLVRVTGLSRPSVHGWKPDAEKRSTMMNGDNAALVCEYLSIRPMWLFHAKGPSGLEDSPTDHDALPRITGPRRPARDEVLCYVEQMDDVGLNRLAVEAKHLAQQFPVATRKQLAS